MSEKYSLHIVPGSSMDIIDLYQHYIVRRFYICNTYIFVLQCPLKKKDFHDFLWPFSRPIITKNLLFRTKFYKSAYFNVLSVYNYKIANLSSY